MQGMNPLAIIVTTLAAFVFSSVWYTVFGKARMKLLGNDQSATADMRKCRHRRSYSRCFAAWLSFLSWHIYSPVPGSAAGWTRCSSESGWGSFPS